MNLDPLDIRILNALQEDARLSFRELARRTRASVPTVSAHVRRLERLGIVRGYRAEIDPLRLGETSIFLIVRPERGRTQTVLSTIAKLPEIRRIVETAENRIVAEATLPRRRRTSDFLQSVRKIRGVAAYEHYIATGRIKDEPRAHVARGTQALVACHECGKVIEDTPISHRLDRREHYFCCRSCETLFVDRYFRVKAAA